MIRMNNQFATIIESGSNDNGSYIKYSDGTMICYHTILPDILNTEYHYQAKSWTYPVSFKEFPQLSATAHNWGTYAYIVKTYSNRIERGNIMQQVINPLTNAFVDTSATEITVFAIGKWK